MVAIERYVLALPLLILSSSGAAAPVAPITNTYSISGFRNDVLLVSDADCSSGPRGSNCQLQYSITIKTLDVNIAVAWSTPDGERFASLSNTLDYYFNYAKKDNYSNNTLIVGKSFSYLTSLPPPLRTETGKATVSGHRFATGNVPNCLNSFTCDAPYYVLTSQAGSHPLRVSGSNALAAAEPVPVAASTRLSLRAYLFGNVDDAQNAVDLPLIEYRSSVAANAGQYLFDYTVENLGVIDQQFDWSEVGLAGTLAVGASVHTTLSSTLAPRLVSNQASLAMDPAMLVPFTIDVLAPVPEPGRAALLIAGMALLGLRMRLARAAGWP
jgi:hypothetical protein